MRKLMIAGNWKMNLSVKQAKDLLLQLNRFVITHNQKSEVVIAPPYPYIPMAVEIFHHNQVNIGAQDVSAYNNGAYTGDVSAEILKSLETDYVIIGHSERRENHKETHTDLYLKVEQALNNNIKVIFCCGEKLEDRNKGNTQSVVKEQIEKVVFDFQEEDIKDIIIAYEPVWAIGTGNAASPEEAQEVHAFIRKLFTDKYGPAVAKRLTILYGGSLKPSNAKEVFAMDDIDGGLIGGASLVVEDFVKLIETLDTFHNIKTLKQN